MIFTSSNPSTLFDCKGSDNGGNQDGNEIPFYLIESGEEKVIPKNLENGVHFRFTNSGILTNLGRLVIQD